ncbi:MAG: hypothetical protein PHH59_06355 [Methylovulum sp.]|uniref:hypothetical protein n=1 Tax=Methylovulum sp. TaxID=1916980 RepID=UPI0026177611|nr:hypothetical protein [Methylovulum sp.]MDD2723627.1 hypothetical protein [Methylovulum sp.]MDD5124308.1 hypothetical protein [Methylovulum sp.]
MSAYKFDSQPTAWQPDAPKDASPSTARQIIRYLRWAGTVLIVISAIGFMLQGHADLLPAYRYWLGLAFTLLLCLGGLICAYGLKETTGARLFFALGVAFLPVQASQVSAMIYNFSQGDLALQLPYRWLQFSQVKPSLIAVDFAITAVLLVLVSYTGFAMLARRQVKTLMAAMLLGNGLLLLPVRDGFWIPLLIACLFFVLRASEQRLRQDSAMHLFEGLAARVLISLPLLILLGRSVLHPVSITLVVALTSMIAVIGVIDIKRYTHSALAIYLGQSLGSIAALVAWLIVADSVSGVGRWHYGLLLPLSLLLFILSAYIDYYATNYRFLGSILALGLVAGALLDGQSFAPLLALATGIALSLAGLRCRERTPFFAGHLCFLSGILFYCRYAIDAYNHAPWLSSIGLGLVVLLAASYLEKRQQVILSKVDAYLNELRSWG